MNAKIIVVIAFGVLALAMCFLSAFYTKAEKVKPYISIKGLTYLSYLTLAIVATNLIFITYAYAIFIILSIALFMFAATVKAIPNRTDMFHSLYTLFESIAFACLVLSIFFLIEFPAYGLVGGIVAFITLLIVYLVKRKSDAKKDKLMNLLLFFCSSIYLGITFNFVVVSFSTISLLLTFSSAFAFVYVILQNFTAFTNKKFGIMKNIFIGVALIIAALAIYFI